MGNHRAARRAPRQATRSVEPRLDSSGYATPGKRSAGRRKADHRSRQRTPLGLPKNSFAAIPTMIGATALVLAGAGVVGLSGNTSQANNLSLSAGANIYSGADVAPASESRTRAISRDSDRQALQDAADTVLKSVTEKQTQERNAALAKLALLAQKRGSEIKKNLWVLPVTNYRLTARFGMGGGLWARGHTGLDFAGPIGSPLLAVANGVITETGYDGSYGNKTVLTLTDGTEIWYCHQNRIDVQVGDTVYGGEQIGERGNTGNSTGPHLHLEVRPGGGDPIDPYTALILHGLNP